MASDPRWTPIPTDLGHALWEVYRQRLGSVVGVGGTCTTDTYVLTEVYVGDTPLLRCETHRDSADAPLETHRHRFCVPVWPDVEAAEEAAFERGVAAGQASRD